MSVASRRFPRNGDPKLSAKPFSSDGTKHVSVEIYSTFEYTEFGYVRKICFGLTLSCSSYPTPAKKRTGAIFMGPFLPRPRPRPLPDRDVVCVVSSAV